MVEMDLEDKEVKKDRLWVRKPKKKKASRKSKFSVGQVAKWIVIPVLSVP